MLLTGPELQRETHFQFFIVLFTEPRGVFETIDQVVKNIRYANRETLRVLQTGKLTGKLQGQVLEKGPIRNILKRIIDRIRERIGR